MNTNNSLSPAQLWIGPHATLVVQTERYLQNIYCVAGGCNSCSICTQINQHQYHACLWFYPENNYTLDTLKPFFSTITRSLNNPEKFFFIFQHSDYLSGACSNSLLKSIEEPPEGYHILFLAQNLQAVAPTLKSRCVISHFNNETLLQAINDLVPFFTTHTTIDFEAFLQTLDKTDLDDRTTLNTLEQIIEYWIKEYKQQNLYSNDSIIKNKLEILNYMIKKTPMPGSTKIFWKNLFLMMQ